MQAAPRQSRGLGSRLAVTLGGLRPLSSAGEASTGSWSLSNALYGAGVAAGAMAGALAGISVGLAWDRHKQQVAPAAPTKIELANGPTKIDANVRLIQSPGASPSSPAGQASTAPKPPAPPPPPGPKSGPELFYSQMLQQRVVFVKGRVEDNMANELVAQLIYLERLDRSKPITMYINSPGGQVSSGLAIYDVMQSIAPPVHTVCVGHAESMGAILLAGGAPGHRWAMPHSHIMIHQPSAVVYGKTTDISIRARRSEACARTLNTILAQHTKKPFDEVEAAVRDDNNMSAEDARTFGIVDSIGSPTRTTKQ